MHGDLRRTDSSREKDKVTIGVEKEKIKMEKERAKGIEVENKMGGYI